MLIVVTRKIGQNWAVRVNLAKHGQANTKRWNCKQVDCMKNEAQLPRSCWSFKTASNWGISPLCTYIVACPYRNWPLYMQELTVALSLRWLMAWTWSPLDSSWGHVKKSRNFKWFPSKSSKELHTGEHYRTLIYIYICQCYIMLLPFMVSNVLFLMLGSRQRSSLPPKTGA